MGAKEQKIRDLRHQFDEIISQVECQAKLGTKLHEAELNLFRSLLKLGKGLLLYYLVRWFNLSGHFFKIGLLRINFSPGSLDFKVFEILCTL
jgi:hypothetical protein